MKKIAFICTFLIAFGCQDAPQDTAVKNCLAQLDSIGASLTFWEAIPVAEEMVEEHPTSAILKLELGEYYLLAYLTENDYVVFVNAKNQLEAAFALDLTFGTTHKDFKQSPTFLINFQRKWTATFAKGDMAEIEAMLILALMDDFESA